MKHLLPLALAATLAGCTATGNDYVKGVVPEISNHPVLGTLNARERVLLGPDANQNGVRDEIDSVASSRYAGARAEAVGFAATFTALMLLGAAAGSSRPAPTASELDAAAQALDALAGPEASNTLATRIANTPERRAAANAAGIKLPG